MALGTLADNLYGKCKIPINVWSVRSRHRRISQVLFQQSGVARLHAHYRPNPTSSRAETSAPYARAKLTTIGGHSITAIGVGHVVPTSCFLGRIEEQNLASCRRHRAYRTRSGPSPENIQISAALVIETSFPNRLQDVADVSRHLTPQTLLQELDKLAMKSPQILITHLKPEFRQEVIRELRKLKGHRLRVLRDGDVLHL